MTRITRTAIAFSAVLLTLPLAACSSESIGSTGEASPTAEPVELATESQVASVVAEYEPDWREVIDNSGDCRLYWLEAADPTNLEASIEGFTCFTREKTLGITAQLVAEDLDSLDVPPSMEDLVMETSTTLRVLSSADLPSACGEGDTPDLASEDCTAALGLVSTGYGVLEQHLNAWGPYL